MQQKKRIAIESSYNPATGKYRLDGLSRGEMPRRRNFDSHAELVAAVEKANPGYEII